MNEKIKKTIILTFFIVYILTICYADYSIKAYINVIDEKYKNMKNESSNLDTNKSYSYTDTLSNIYSKKGLEISSINNSEDEGFVDLECNFNGTLQEFIDVLSNIEKGETFNGIKFINIKREDTDNISAKTKLQFLK